MSRRPPSIAIVRQRYNPYGGAERFVDRALAALAMQGADVTLITREWRSVEQESPNYKLLTVNPGVGFSVSPRKARDEAFCRTVQEAIGREHFDLVQTHERIPGCAIFRAGDGVHAAWLDRRAAAIGPLARLGLKFSPYHRYVLDTERAMFEHPKLKAVICNSQMVADEIHSYYGVDRSKLAVIYNGVDLERFNPNLREQFRVSARRNLGIPESAAVFLFVGSGFERKGVPQLLEAFAAIGNSVAHLVVVGADRKMKHMQKRAGDLGIADRVHFTGPVNDVRPYYGLADVFALPTWYDPGPNAALEALACGLPMLTSEGCGAKEWIEPGKNGFVVDLANPSDLQSSLNNLLRLAQNPEARDFARQSVERLDLASMSERLLRLYAEMTE